MESLIARLHTPLRGKCEPRPQFHVRDVYSAPMSQFGDMKYRYRVPIYLSTRPSTTGISYAVIEMRVYETHFEISTFSKNSQRRDSYRQLESQLGLNTKCLATSVLVAFLQQHLVPQFGLLPVRVYAESSHLEHGKNCDLLVEFYKTLGFSRLGSGSTEWGAVSLATDATHLIQTAQANGKCPFQCDFSKLKHMTTEHMHTDTFAIISKC